MKKSAIEAGKTYVNRGAGTTLRTVLRITESPTEEETPQWWSENPRPVEPVVIFQASNRPGFDSLYLSSFASWAGREKVSDLILHVKGKYFDEIKTGTKRFEYRLQTDYWRKRLVGREYDRVVICLGYPSSDDTDRRISFPWREYEEQTITHEHFGPDPVRVFAITLEMDG